MKRTFTTLLLLVCICMGATAQADWIKKYENMKGVQRVFVSESMAKMASGFMESVIPDSKSDKDATNNIVKNLKGVLILTATTAESKKSLQEDCEKIKKGKEYELLLESSDDGERTKIFVRPSKEKKTKGESHFQEMLLFSMEGNNTALIQILGDFTDKDIQALTKN